MPKALGAVEVDRRCTGVRGVVLWWPAPFRSICGWQCGFLLRWLQEFLGLADRAPVNGVKKGNVQLHHPRQHGFDDRRFKAVENGTAAGRCDESLHVGQRALHVAAIFGGIQIHRPVVDAAFGIEG